MKGNGFAMSVCPQCGSPTKDNDKFCNGCGHPLAALAPPPPAAPAPPAWGAPPPPPAGDAWGAPPPPAGDTWGQPPQAAQPPLQQGYVAPGAFGGPPAAAASPYGPPPGAAPVGYGAAPNPPQPSARCQQGHEIQPGASYCAAGHPIALDAMQFASDAYGAPPAPAYQPPPPAQYGAPQQQAPAFGAFGGGAQPGGFAPPQPAQGLGGQPGYGDPVPAFGGPNAYGAPQQPPQQQGYGQPAPQGFGYNAPGVAPPAPAFAPPAPFAPPPAAFAPPVAAYAPPPVEAPQALAHQAPQPPQAAQAPQGAAGQIPNRILRGFLCSFQANTQGEFWPLHGGRVGVGRANAGETVDIQLADATISSRHAALLVDNVSGAISVEDTGSTNGTYVNDEHLGFNGRRELRDGDRLRFGGFTTIVKVIGRVS